MDHRRTPSRNLYVPSSWFVVLTIVACLAAVGGLGWLLVVGDTSKDSATPPSATATTPAPEPTETEPTETEPTPTPTPTPTETETVSRDTPVSVLNNTGTPGAAGAFSTKVEDAGWTVGGVGNWRGSVAENTVYYPDGLQEQAEQLAKDVGIDRVLPRVDPMRTDRLTIILSGPQ